MMRTSLSSTHRARAALLLVACVAVTVATWLIPASIHGVGWQGGTPSRVALVPPLERLLALASLAVLAVLVLTRLSADRLDAVPQVSAHLALLWLPDQVLLVLLLSGPTRWIVLCVALIGCAMTAITGPRAEALRSRPLPGHRAVFVVTVTLLLVVGG